MPINVQVKLLNALESGKFFRVGGEDEVETKFRLISATNKPINELVKLGIFRSDLFFRIDGVHIHLEPLRNNNEDILQLGEHFFDEFKKEYRKEKLKYTKQFQDVLLNHTWPGNIRELKNKIKETIALSDKGKLNINYLKEKIKNTPITNIKHIVNEEKLELIDKLKKYSGNVSEVARDMGITRATVYKRLGILNIDYNQYR